MDPSVFLFGNRDPMVIPTSAFIDKNVCLAKWILNNDAVGYCINPNYTGSKDFNAAVMFAEDDNEYWCHIPEGVVPYLNGKKEIT